MRKLCYTLARCPHRLAAQDATLSRWISRVRIPLGAPLKITARNNAGSEPFFVLPESRASTEKCSPANAEERSSSKLITTQASGESLAERRAQGPLAQSRESEPTRRTGCHRTWAPASSRRPRAPPCCPRRCAASPWQARPRARTRWPAPEHPRCPRPSGARRPGP